MLNTTSPEGQPSIDPPTDQVVCVLLTTGDWAPLWRRASDRAGDDVGLVLVEGAPAYPVHGLATSVRVYASGVTHPVGVEDARRA